MRVSGLDHLQLDVADVERSLRFYRDVLGMQVWSVEPPDRAFLRAGRAVLTLVRTSGRVRTDGFHFGFLADSAEELDRWRSRLEGSAVAIDEVTNTTGGSSVYVRDPDGYRIEVFHVFGWTE